MIWLFINSMKKKEVLNFCGNTDSYEGIPSDENFLNDEIGRTNELFADLLDLQ